MFFIPLGLLIANDASIVSKVGLTNAQIGNLVGNQGIVNFLWGNLVPVTLGNIVGGAIFVSLLYWWVYMRTPLVTVKVDAAKATQPAK
jgi:formate/nitrite transporter FocA (FNT family)